MKEKKYIISAEAPPAAGSVMTHAMKIFLNSDQSTAGFDLSANLVMPYA